MVASKTRLCWIFVLRDCTGERLYGISNLNVVEDDIHFLNFCPSYQEMKDELYQNVLSLDHLLMFFFTIYKYREKISRNNC